MTAYDSPMTAYDSYDSYDSQGSGNDMLHARLEQGSDSHPPSETEIQMVLSSALPALAQSPPVGGVSGSTMSRNGAIREALLAGSSRSAPVLGVLQRTSRVRALSPPARLPQ